MRFYFDIDDTLFPSTEFSKLARKNAVRAMISMGLNYSERFLMEKLEEIIRDKGSNYSRHFDELCKTLKIKKPSKFIAAAVAAYHDTKASIFPYPEVPYVLKTLNERGYELFVVSEGLEKKQWDKLIRLGLTYFFKKVYVTRNKTVKFYSKLKKGIVVGDNPLKDVEFAKKAGHIAVRVKRGKRAKMKSNADYTITDLRQLLKIDFKKIKPLM